MSDVRKFLKDYCAKKGYEVSDEGLGEVLAESDNVVWEGDRDEHRWYICIDRVVCIDGTFIKYTDYIITGDGCMSDMGLEYDIDGAKFVEKKERVITEEYYE